MWCEKLDQWSRRVVMTNYVCMLALFDRWLLTFWMMTCIFSLMNCTFLNGDQQYLITWLAFFWLMICMFLVNELLFFRWMTCILWWLMIDLFYLISSFFIRCFFVRWLVFFMLWLALFVRWLVFFICELHFLFDDQFSILDCIFVAADA